MDMLRGGGGWRDLDGCSHNLGNQRSQTAMILGKHAREQSGDQGSEMTAGGGKRAHTSEVIDLTASSPAPEDVLMVESHRSSSPVEYGSGDEYDVDMHQEKLLQKAADFEEAARILRSQIPHGNPIWMKSIVDRKIGNDVTDFVADVRRFESTRRKGTQHGGKEGVRLRDDECRT